MALFSAPNSQRESILRHKCCILFILHSAFVAACIAAFIAACIAACIAAFIAAFTHLTIVPIDLLELAAGF